MKKIAIAKNARTARDIFSLINNPLPSKKPSQLPKFASAQELVNCMKPSEPVHCMRPQVIETAAKYFVRSFSGKVMYAVKTNPDPIALKTIYNSGVCDFDVASLAEVALVAKECAGANMHYMHPVKSRESIMFAYNKYGVRSFSLDSMAELEKICQMTNNAKDLNLYVRLAIPNENAAYSLQGKFGIKGTEAIELLKATRKVAAKLGICFHVGSQCMDPDDYRTAIAKVRWLIDDAEVKVDAIDVGGGFPSIYPDLAPQELDNYMSVIKNSLEEYEFDKGFEIFCEPGRAIVAENGSVVVKVELRKGDALYLNDGVYGSLFDAGYPAFIYPTKALRIDGEVSGELKAFSFFGPTCDSLDTMKGPFMLPANIEEGDWIEIGGLGAYSKTMQTNFNGFYSDKQAELSDAPMLSMFGLA